MGESIEDNKPLDTCGEHDPALIASLQRRTAEGATLMVKAFGASMHPFIRNGETIAVRAVPMEQISIGDVIFFHHRNRLFTHRLIKKQPPADTQEGDFLFVTKGDSLRFADEPIPPGRVIGKVIAICRGGEIVTLDQCRQKIWARLMIRLGFAYGSLFGFAVKLRVSGISRLTRLRIYRALRKRLPREPLVCRPFEMRDLNRFAGLIAESIPGYPMDEFLALAKKQVEQIAERGSNLFIAERGRTLVGAFQGGQGIIEKEFGVGGWWIMGLYVRVSQRGLGVGEALAKALVDLAAQQGADAVYVNFFVTNRASRGLFEKMGFVRCEPETEAKLNEGYQKISAELPYTIALKYPFTSSPEC